MLYKRNIYKALSEHASKKQVSVVTGLRRTGKTTLIKQLLQEFFPENSIYIDLERLDNRQLFQAPNYDSVVLALSQRGLNFNKKCTIAIDEAQLLSQLPSVVKYLYDTYDIKFIISGSSSYYIKNLFNESLAGRKKIFEVFPLDFGEYLTFKQIPWKETEYSKAEFDINDYNRLSKWYNEYIEFGGFPEVVLAEQASDKTDLLEDIISSYINIDIKWLSDFKSVESIRNLIVMLATRTASKLDVSKIAALTGLSLPTVNNYIELFEQTYLIQRIPVISKNPDREIVKAKKIFFCDNGIVNRLVQNSSGVLFENCIFNQLKNRGKLNYYSLKNGQEIDFIFNDSIAYEVKETATMSDFQQLKKLATNIDITNNFIFSKYPSPTFKDSIWGGSIK